jgi:hypothetical protein
MRTFDLIECADFLKVDRNTAMKLAGTGELPGAKIGRAWVFLEDDVVAFLRKRTQEQSLARLQGAFEPEVDARVAQSISKQLGIPDHACCPSYRPLRRPPPVEQVLGKSKIISLRQRGFLGRKNLLFFVTEKNNFFFLAKLRCSVLNRKLRYCFFGAAPLNFLQDFR